MMSLLPLHIEMRDRKVLIVGGGTVAVRKAAVLLSSGARVLVVSPDLSRELEEQVAVGRVTWRRGTYHSADLDGIFLVVAATGDSAVNSAVAADARARGIMAAVVDAPELGNCTFPAALRRGELVVSVSSGGGSPAFAARVRDVIATVIGEEYGQALELLAEEREKLLTEAKGSTYNSEVLRSRARELIDQLTERKERVP